MSSHVSNALALEVSAFFRSAGRSWTTPPEIAFLLNSSLVKCIAPASRILLHISVAGIERHGGVPFGADADLRKSCAQHLCALRLGALPLSGGKIEFGVWDEVHELPLGDFADIFPDLNQAVRLAQRRDKSRAVARKFGDRDPPVFACRQSDAPELASPHLLRLREHGRQLKAPWLGPRAAGKPCQRRPHIDQKTDEHRNRIARQAEHHAIADLAEAHRPAGLDRDLPQMTLAERIEALHYVILGALARAA